jgi:hypothetical protein
MYDWAWLLAWGLASSVWCWTAARHIGATFDEPVYVARGLDRWRTGSHQGLMQLGTMPVPVDLDTLPLYLWERWHGTRLDPVADLDLLLPWARAGTLVFWWLLLTYGRLAGRQLAGPWGGRLAVALLACEPSLLAHASLATTDVAITACLLALVYHFRTGRQAGWGRRVALPTGWFAAALLAKASGLVFGPLCLVVVECERLLGKSTRLTDLSVWKPFRRDLSQILAGGLLLAFLYCGSDWRPEPSFVSWAHRLPEGPGSRVMTWLAEHLQIFSNAGEGLVRQIKHNVRGHGTYLLGTVAERSIWYYFPVALTVKLSVPLLILPLVLLVLRPRSLVNWASLSALVLLAFSVTCRVQIGIRLVLPLVSLAIVGMAAAVVQAGRAARERGGEGEKGRREKGEKASRSTLSLSPLLPFSPSPLLPFSPSPLLLLLVSAGVVWTVVAAVNVWPHGLCYTNVLWGGTERGYLVLSDSNYDWGQGLKDLARWQQSHGDVPVDVWYFGTDPAIRKLPLREVTFHALSIQGPEDVQVLVHGHYLAVSTTLLHGSISTTLHSSNPEAAASYARVLAFLSACQPVDRTATFLIYDFREVPCPCEVASTSISKAGRVSVSQPPLTEGPEDRPR